VPTGTVPLDQDYLNLQGNNQQLDVAYGYDHVPFSDTSGLPPPGISGKHKVIHFNPDSTVASNPPKNYPIVPPAAVVSAGELFTTESNDEIATDQTLWYQSAGGLLMQLTRNFAPVAASTGRTFLPGGLILQWGVITAVSQTLTGSTFAGLGGIAFPAAAYNMQTSIREAASSGANVLNISSLTATGFDYFNTSSSVRSFFWFAIGI
jgi:hypothetical protein